MRALLFVFAAAVLLAPPASAETADQIVARYVQSSGGIDKIRAVETLRRSGRSIRGGGIENPFVQVSKRPFQVREETTRAGQTGVVAFDGASGWKISPWQGKKDPEPLSEMELKMAIDDADFDGPLVDAAKKGVKIDYLGKDDFEGTEVYKLRVTAPKGSARTYYLDTESCMPLKIETKLVVRGAEREFETTLGNYKPVAGWMLPFWTGVGPKGSSEKRQFVFDTIEANVPLGDDTFRMPAIPAVASAPKGASR
jgi:outer membrane lipoprotein-sorting protein